MRASRWKCGITIVVAGALTAVAATASATSQLHIAGAKSDGFKFQTSAGVFEHDFSVVAENGEPAQLVAVEVPAFPDSVKNPEVKPSFDSGVTVDLTHSATFHLKATLDHEGTYETDIELVDAKKRTFIPFTVVRTAPSEQPSGQSYTTCPATKLPEPKGFS